MTDLEADLKIAQARIKELEAKVPKWISVTERLPEDGRRVLAAHDDGMVRIGMCQDKYFPAVVARKHTKAFGLAEVTHWMPLPEAPKGE